MGSLLSLVGTFVGGGLGQILKVWTVLKNFPLTFKILNNFGLIKEIYLGFDGLAKRLIVQKSMSCDDTRELFKLLEKALDSGLIDFPNVDEHELALALHDLQNNLVCQINQGEKFLKGLKNG